MTHQTVNEVPATLEMAAYKEVVEAIRPNAEYVHLSETAPDPETDSDANPGRSLKPWQTGRGVGVYWLT